MLGTLQCPASKRTKGPSLGVQRSRKSQVEAMERQRGEL